MSKRVVITGGAGFIGRESVRKLVTAGYDVVCFDLAEQINRHRPYLDKLATLGKLKLVPGSLLDRNAVRQAVDGSEVVLHLAAMLGVKKTEDNKLSCIEININGTDNVLNAAVSHGVKKFVLASSSEVYGEPSRNPIRETDNTQGKTVYAVTKLAGEELVKGYHQRYPSMDYTIVRFFNTYGEGQVAQFVLCKFVREVMEGRNPVVYGDGNQVRSYGHVDDVVEGVKRIIENPVSNSQVYNLGNSTQVMTLTELAQRVIDLVGPQKGLRVEILGGFEGSDRVSGREIHTRYCDTSHAKTDLGFEPRITVDEGIRRIAAQEVIHSDWPSC
ncbi:MAG: NAD(P)-dependent oxidoreductase [Sulfuritalea sp.]|nr:NAD(P)-dependent oxidoreductase [Sulfuritalea sp.]